MPGCALLVLDLVVHCVICRYYFVTGIFCALSPTSGKVRKELLGPYECRRGPESGDRTASRCRLRHSRKGRTEQ